MLLGLLVVAWRSPRSRAANAFALTLVAILVWTIGYILELSATTLAAKLAFTNVQYLGVAALPVLWLTVVMAHISCPRPRWFFLLWIVPAATTVFAWTNPGSIFYAAPRIIAGDGSPQLFDYGYGLWASVVSTTYGVALALAATILLVRSATREEGERRWQTALLLASTLLPLLSALVNVAGGDPLAGYDLTPAVFGLSGALMALALFRFRLFDVAPLARDTVVENMPDPVLVLDARALLADFNRAAAHLLPSLGRHPIGTPVGTALADEPELLDRLGSAGTLDTELTMERDGEKLHYSLETFPVRGPGGTVTGRAAVFHDVTERVALFEQAKELASLDCLTGIFNRRHFFELSRAELNRARRHGTPVSLILFDLDYFKRINDTRGHVCGDRVLRAVAEACGGRLRSFDVFGRYGGEEFAVTLPDMGAEGALMVAERLRRGIAAVSHESGDIGVSASFGVASVPTARGATFDELVVLADEALYRAKSRGRDRVELATRIPAANDVVA